MVLPTWNELLIWMSALGLAFGAIRAGGWRHGKLGPPMAPALSRLFSINIVLVATAGVLLHMWIRTKATRGGTPYPDIIPWELILFGGAGFALALNAVQEILLEFRKVAQQERRQWVLYRTIKILIALCMILLPVGVIVSSIRQHP